MSIHHIILGTGAIGRAIAEELISRDESVRIVNRYGQIDIVPAKEDKDFRLV